MILKKVKSLSKKEKWEEEFEDTLIRAEEFDVIIGLKKRYLDYFLLDYLDYGKVKIKARKGKIVIERIK